jgi:AcrR family transcriptional regulator
MGRKYQLKQRAKRQEETRRRIVEAAVELHGIVGPARTTILALAERAGVERPTVYRHFPTMESLFRACSSHHWTENPPPDPNQWLAINDPEARLRRGLGELYAYYSLHELRMWNILRDVEDMPELRPFAAHRMSHREHVRQVLASAWPDKGLRHKLLAAAIGHAVDFFSWRALRRQKLTDAETIELMIGMIRSIQSGGIPPETVIGCIRAKTTIAERD